MAHVCMYVEAPRLARALLSHLWRRWRRRRRQSDGTKKGLDEAEAAVAAAAAAEAAEEEAAAVAARGTKGDTIDDTAVLSLPLSLSLVSKVSAPAALLTWKFRIDTLTRFTRSL